MDKHDACLDRQTLSNAHSLDPAAALTCRHKCIKALSSFGRSLCGAMPSKLASFAAAGASAY
eukprot:6328721-Amphidinium_carterae.1